MSFTSAILRPQTLLRSRMTSEKHSDSTPNSHEPSSPSTSTPPPMRLLHYDDLPPWYQDNPFIKTHYRPVSHSLTSCLTSIFTLHNETLNIHTHLLPALLLLALTPLVPLYLYFTQTTTPRPTPTDLAIFAWTLLAALTTAALSAAYHTLMNHSPGVSSRALRADYAGILLLIHASFLSGTHVAFYSAPRVRNVYWGMITGLSLVAGVLTLHPRLQGLAWRALRTGVFVLVALSGVAPVVHGVVVYGWAGAVREGGVGYWVGEGVAYGAGAAVFATRWPERWVREGRCDVWGSSHQVFHVCVVLGAAVHCWGVWETWKVHVGM